MRKLMIAGLSALALCAAPLAHAADTPAAAPDPAKIALVKRYFAAMHFGQMMSGMMHQMGPAMMAQMRQAHPEVTDAQMQGVSDAMGATMDEYLPKMMDAMVPVYADTFSTEELTKLDEFYESPIGQSIVSKTPLAMQKMMPVMIKMMPDMQADMMKRMCAKVDCSAKKAG